MKIDNLFVSLFFCLGIGFPLFAIELAEFIAFQNIQSNKKLAEFDWATADFYVQLCKQKKLTSNLVCKQAATAYDRYMQGEANVQIFGF